MVRNVIDTDYSALPSAVVDMTKKLILDALACSVAGSSASGMKELAELIKEWGGKEESTIISFRGRVPSLNAALVNASMNHILDFDDTHDVAVIHPEAPPVAASFAVAERRGGVVGKELITAVALGIDLSCRMCMGWEQSMTAATGNARGWDVSSLYGYFSAAAAAGKILGLDENKLISAFGIAYQQAAGNTQPYILSPAPSKGLETGFAAMGGTIAALLAERGMAGPRVPLEGDYGLYSLYHRGDWDPDPVTRELGKTFMVESDSFKPYPNCRMTHAYIDAILFLVKQNDIKPADVERVTIFAGTATYDLCQPLDIQQKPPSAIASQFSLPWAVATAITYRKAEIKHFSEEAIKNLDVIQLAKKVITHLDEGLTCRGIEPAIVEIETKDGKVYRKRKDCASGSPEEPWSMEDVVRKFRDCVTYAVNPIQEEKVRQTVQMVEELEDVADVGQIVPLLG